MSLSKFNRAGVQKNYEHFVLQNINLVSLAENVLKVSSFLVSGRFQNGYLIGELFYSLSNLITLFNDQIINKQLEPISSKSKNRIQLWLTVLSYSEVFLEISICRKYGHRAKWIVICFVECLKFILRTILIYKHQEIVIGSPPLKPLDRTELEFDEFQELKLSNAAFVLPSTGRVIRKISHTKFKLYDNEYLLNENRYSLNLYLAETLYSAKPLIHLVYSSYFGYSNWKSWFLTFTIDFISLKLDGKQFRELNNSQKIEVMRRHMTLLMYLIRSPFYDTFSKDKIIRAIKCLSKLPLFNIFFASFNEHFPDWQSTYFHIWTQ